MIDLPDLPVPIEKMYFYNARRKDGAVEVFGVYNDPNDGGFTKRMLIGTYREYRSAVSALDEIGTLQTATKALLR